MSNKNEVFAYLIGQLRQQVNGNQCEDLAHEVLSLKNQLRDASEHIKELHKALATATGDVGAYIAAEQSGAVRKILSTTPGGRITVHDNLCRMGLWYLSGIATGRSRNTV